MEVLKNSEIEISISKKGAEIQNIRRNNIEYLWQADPTFWPRKAPILFPIVGRVKNNMYSIGGNQYQLSQHGFARDRDFELLEKSDIHVSYRLTSDESSLTIYPFKFEVIISYKISGRRIEIQQVVKNRDSQTMYYGLGNHPGFQTPLNNMGSYNDYYLEFEFPENLYSYTLQEGYLSDIQELLVEGSNILPLTQELFANDALIFDVTKLRSKWVSLKNKISSTAVKVDFTPFSWLGIWSKPGPFVCIEPWAGVTDKHDHNGDFTQKLGVNKLDPGNSHTYQWYIEVQ